MLLCAGRRSVVENESETGKENQVRGSERLDSADEACAAPAPDASERLLFLESCSPSMTRELQRSLLSNPGFSQSETSESLYDLTDPATTLYSIGIHPPSKL